MCTFALLLLTVLLIACLLLYERMREKDRKQDHVWGVVVSTQHGRSGAARGAHRDAQQRRTASADCPWSPRDLRWGNDCNAPNTTTKYIVHWTMYMDMCMYIYVLWLLVWCVQVLPGVLNDCIPTRMHARANVMTPFIPRKIDTWWRVVDLIHRIVCNCVQ